MVRRHCPFLNREDVRCGTHFSVNRLQQTFDHCFGAYDRCPSYGELLSERRVREEALTTLTIGGRVATQDESHRSDPAAGLAAH